MNKKKVLIVGFGGIGCRHAQSLLDKKEYEVHIAEHSDITIKKNLKIIGANKNNFIWHKDIKNTPVLDLAIIATSSQPRFEIVKILIKNGFRKFLLEKIVFQSEKQFYKIIEMMNKSNSKAYCNFVHRYYIPYKEIKNQLSQSSEIINIHIQGNANELGMGCNAIHFIDLFQYLTGIDEVKLKKYELKFLKGENRRGSIYKEFYGMLEFRNNRKNMITIKTDLRHNEGIAITISQGKKNYQLNQKTQKFLTNDNDLKMNNEFKIIPSSKLTYITINDIFKNDCRMTQLDQTLLAHTPLFNAFNTFVYNEHKPDTLCPIT